MENWKPMRFFTRTEELPACMVATAAAVAAQINAQKRWGFQPICILAD